MYGLDEYSQVGKQILELADNMAAGATQMGVQGYETLMTSRDELKRVTQKLVENLRVER
jgi:hypothetical protein